MAVATCRVSSATGGATPELRVAMSTDAASSDEATAAVASDVTGNTDGRGSAGPVISSGAGSP
jgi:hypothetical protein